MSVPTLCRHLSKQRAHLSFSSYRHVGEINRRQYWFVLPQFLWYKKKILTSVSDYWRLSMWSFHDYFSFLALGLLCFIILYSFTLLIQHFPNKELYFMSCLLYAIIWGYFSKLGLYLIHRISSEMSYCLSWRFHNKILFFILDVSQFLFTAIHLGFFFLESDSSFGGSLYFDSWCFTFSISCLSLWILLWSLLIWWVKIWRWHI